ncbi:MAG TPA: DNA polymerase III subunit gamma/tau [Myxococcales bacterium]|nr:DNA polymerase III subunit gamma/tau [Myxococcales bacterium]
MIADADYQVLARKWRPQRFDEMSGQEHVVRTLRNAVAGGRVAHAYLFCGPRGVGKTTAARLLARCLNCEKGPTPDPCGECQACREIALGSSVDVAEIDGASNNGVDDVRAIRENARYLPSRDRYKIYIIDEVHMLSQAAFNALLKTLEEPPPHVKFIFATTELHKVPETIVSRCQLHTFRRIPLAQVAAKLEEVSKAEGFGIDTEGLGLIARQAEGGMRDALSLLDQVVSSCGKNPKPEEIAEALGAVDRRAVVALARALVARDAAALVRLLGEQYDRGNEPRRVGEALCRELRQVVVCKAVGAPPAELPDHEQRDVEALAKDADGAQLARLFDLVHGALAELGRAFEPQLALEVALLKGIFLAPGSEVSELLARAEALTRGGVAAGALSRPGPVPASVPAPRESPRPPPLAGEKEKGSPSQPPIHLGERSAEGAARRERAGGAKDDPSLSPLDRLAALVKTAVAQSPRIGTALKNGRLKDLRPGELTLCYPAGDFRAALLAAERGAVEALLAAHFGAPTRLVIREGEEAGAEPSLAEREARGTAERNAQVKAAALSSDAVKDALRLLGGEVEEVRVLDPTGRK